MRNTEFISYAKIGLYLLAPMVFIFVPISYFEFGPIICLTKNIFGIECPGCGITRAIASIFHADFVSALRYNRFIVIVFPLLCYAYMKNILADYRRIKLPK